MRIPVPTNRLVAFTLAGALLTMIVAAGLAVPGFGPAAQSTGDTSSTAPDAPQPNENFTPDVQTGAEYEDEDYEEEEHEEYEGGDDEYEEHEEEEHEEYEDGEEYEEKEYEED